MFHESSLYSLRSNPHGSWEAPPPHQPSHVGAVGGWWGVYSALDFFSITGERLFVDVTLEHLLVCLPEVFWEKGIYDGVHRGVAVCQAVSSDPEEEGSLSQRKGSKLSPEVDDMMGQPGYAKNHNHHQDGLCGLEERSNGRGLARRQELCEHTNTSEEHSTVKHTPIASLRTSMGSNKSVKFDLP